MLESRHYVLRQILVFVDLLLGLAAFFIAHWLRQTIVAPWLLPEQIVYVDGWVGYSWLLVFVPLLTVMFLTLNGHYDTRRIRSRFAASRIILLSVAEAAVAAFLMSVFFREEGRVSRAQTLLIPLVLYGLLEIRASISRRILLQRRRAGGDRLRMLLVGSGSQLAEIIALLKRYPLWGFELLGVVSDSNLLRAGDSLEGIPVLGPLDEALEILRGQQVDEVLVAPTQASLQDIAPLMGRCEEMGIRAHLSLSSFEHTIARPTIDMFHHFAVATYSPVREMGPLLMVKYVFDRVASAALLILLSPLIVFIMIAIRLTSTQGEPIFFGQRRCGLNGKLFTCWKFRSMRVNAELERERLEALNEADGPVFKIRNDPRVTPLGRFLRKYSLDELPQLWNVLVGDMSLVGPRPPLPEEVEQYDPWQRRRLSMRPGITCLWQVSGRSDLPFETWMKLDLQYIDNWSLWLDFKILLKTLYVVVTARGAA